MLQGIDIASKDSGNTTVHYRKLVHLKMLAFAKCRARLDSEELEWLLEVKRLGLWRDFGCATALEYLERVLGYTPHAASERIRVAFELESLPGMKRALRDGELCFSAVRELTRVAEAGTEVEWIAAAKSKNVRQIEELVAHHTKGDRPSDSPDPTPKRCKLFFVELAPETLAMVREARKALQAEMGGERLDDNTFLQTLCRRALEGPAGGEGVVTPPAHQIALVTCKRCKTTWQNGAGAQLVVDDVVRERAACDAKDLGDLDAPDPARVTQSVTPRKRAQVFARDGYRCCVPGCRASYGLDIHHIEPQEEGGGHEMSNLCLLCSGHHGQTHQGRLTLIGQAPDRLEFRWSRGTWWASSHVGREREGAPIEPEVVSPEEMDALRAQVEEIFAKLPDLRMKGA